MAIERPYVTHLICESEDRELRFHYEKMARHYLDIMVGKLTGRMVNGELEKFTCGCLYFEGKKLLSIELVNGALQIVNGPLAQLLDH